MNLSKFLFFFLVEAIPANLSQKHHQFYAAQLAAAARGDYAALGLFTPAGIPTSDEEGKPLDLSSAGIPGGIPTHLGISTTRGHSPNSTDGENVSPSGSKNTPLKVPQVLKSG